MLNKKTYKNLRIRFAEEKDAEVLLDFIKKLAVYEKRPESVIATAEDIRKNIFEKKIAEALIAEQDGMPAGFAIFYYNFSTFIGKPGIYIEDLFVNEHLRGNGIGKAIFNFIAEIAIRKDCASIEWTVLKWNKPSIRFYEKLGAKKKDEWFIYRLDTNFLQNNSSSGLNAES